MDKRLMMQNKTVVPADFFLYEALENCDGLAGNMAFRIIECVFADEVDLMEGYHAWMDACDPSASEIMAMSGVPLVSEEELDVFLSWGFGLHVKRDWGVSPREWLTKNAFQFLDFIQKSTPFEVRGDVVHLSVPYKFVPHYDPRLSGCIVCETGILECDMKLCDDCDCCWYCCECDTSQFNPMKFTPQQMDLLKHPLHEVKSVPEKTKIELRAILRLQ